LQDEAFFLPVFEHAAMADCLEALRAEQLENWFTRDRIFL